MKRRDFVKACAATAILVHHNPRLLAMPDARPSLHHRVRLVDNHGRPIHLSDLEPHVNYIFRYPYEATPCFLLNLDRPTEANVPLKTENGGEYVWTGGVGPERSIVAYAAICAHRLAHPTPHVNFISYRRDPLPESEGERAPNLITCCMEYSSYDPARGAEVVSGPAPQPLTGILLEYDARADELSAVGTTGEGLYERFFGEYAMQLGLNYGSIEKARAPVTGQAIVEPLSEYTDNDMPC